MEMLYDYKDVFSLRDEIGTCPNREVNIEVTDNSPFFIRTVLDKEMRRLCYLGILKEGFSAYSSPVMLISRKMTSDKRVVTDFRHLYMRIAKNNLAYPLLKDTFALLESSKCEVMSVLDLKDAFHSLRLLEKSQKYCGTLPYFGSASYLYQRVPMGLNVFPPIWQSYVNTILNSLQSRKHCEAIMDDLLLFTPSKIAHIAKLEDLLKDLKDAFHSLRLLEKSQKYCGTLPYFGSASYLYQRVPMGLNVSPPIWQSYVNTILNSLQSRKYCEAIMDDLLLFTPSKIAYIAKLDLLKALRKNGLKISPKKCQLFRMELQYMGNTIFIKNRRVCIKPLHS